MSQTTSVRWYTKARRFPLAISRTTAGEVIPGGPYTALQIVTGVVSLLVMMLVVKPWDFYGFLGGLVLIAGSVAGTVLAAGMVPDDQPLPAGSGLGAARQALRLTAKRLQPAKRPVVVRSHVLFSATTRPQAHGQDQGQTPRDQRQLPAPLALVAQADRRTLAPLSTIQQQLAAS